MSRPAGKRPSRLIAAEVVAGVVAGDSLNSLLAPALEGVADAGERALVQELVYGTLRWHPRLAALADLLFNRPVRARDRVVRLLAEIGLYQLAEMRIPDHAAVSETVAAARKLARRPWAAGLVNAVLRRYLRERETLETRLAGQDDYRYAHPDWLVHLLREDWPDDWESVLEAGNRRPPMALRVNLDRQDRETCLRRFADAGLEAHPHPWTDTAVMLDPPAPVDRLPGFAEGEVSVQDVSPQLAAGLLDPQAGERVLDACAAPGGKTVHLLERAGGGVELFALDVDPGRLARVAENLDRGGYRATLAAGDARRPDAWWDGRPFQRILLDAPCSATGVIRRHPDIKLLRREADIASLAEIQLEMLEALWPLLAPGGRLVYCTCSVLRRENTAVIERFLERRPAAMVHTIGGPWGRADGPGRQILTGEEGADGFYYACLIKRENQSA
ncbi:MAG: 16S rRNA (cytosine(967)-C(5))-methyltransferase RsmB [Gammaproteobacteria bacterium]